MRPSRYSYTPAAASATGFATGITGAGPWTPTATNSGDSLAHFVTIVSAANLSAINFTLTGTDADGIAQTEVLAGPNATTVTGTKYFKTLTGISASSTLGANTANVGWAANAVSQTFPLNWRQDSFQVSLGLELSGTINVTVQHCLADIRSAAPSTLTWWPHASLVSKTASADGNYAFPVSATRLLVNSVTAGGTAALTIAQGA